MSIDERASTHVYRQKQLFTKEELEARESLCIHEELAYCDAECPLKLDVKAILAAVAKGDFDKAYALYEKNCPFPHLIAAGCEAPCEKVCKRNEVGEGVAIRRIEEALVAYGKAKKGFAGLRKTMKKKKTVAMIGSGLFMLLLLGEVAKKNYPLDVYCRESDKEAWLRVGADFANDTVLEKTMKLLDKMEVTFHFENVLSANLVQEVQGQADVTAVSMDVLAMVDDAAVPDEALMYFEERGLVCGPSEGVLGSAFAAKKAAVTVDRLAQNLHPSNTRGEEGPTTTRLHTSLEGVAPSVQVASEGVFTKEQAQAEAARCLQCHCDECMKACPYLRHYNKFPRLLTREIYNNVGIIMGDHVMNKPINACALCGQCKVICPNGFDVAEVCQKARENMVFTGKMPLAPHEFALMDMLFSNGEAFLARPAVEAETKYVFFPGCQASAIAPATVRAAYLDLAARMDGGVGLLLGCCGIISKWAGRTEMYEETQAQFKNALQEMGNPVVVCACPMCERTLKEWDGVRTTGLWNVLEDIGLPLGADNTARTVALHDSCGARGDDDTQAAIRRIAGALGCEIVPTVYDGDASPCCGYGGLTQYANPEVAGEMTEMCLSRTDAPYLTYCMACRDRFARKGRESMHILELVYGTNADHCPDISQKRYNRLGLKQQLLSECWKEELELTEVPFKIEYAPEALADMDHRLILKSDVVQVLTALRETDEAILDAETGVSVTRARLGNVTVWVKFKDIEGGYLVVGAYSHRMTITRRE